jgi:hypothetical protein
MGECGCAVDDFAPTTAPVPDATAAPVTSDSPETSAPVTSPGYPPCQVCGVGMVVTISSGSVSLPDGAGPLSCEALQIQGLTGYVEPQYCAIAFVFMSECGCAVDDFAPQPLLLSLVQQQPQSPLTMKHPLPHLVDPQFL